MDWTCEVCKKPVVPDEHGYISTEGVCEIGSKTWVWGPVAVHGDCRFELRTPFDDQLGKTHWAPWHKVRA
ncbi:MAG: hypothetical protein ACT4P1_15985 [Sporichthyaceae bacterium]